MTTTISPMTSTLQGHTACQVMTMPMQMADGSVRQQVYLVPFYGPIPAQTTVLTSLQQLQQFMPPAQAGPTLVPSPQPQKAPNATPIQIVSPSPVQIAAKNTQRTDDTSGKLDTVDANGATNENKVLTGGESSATSPSIPSAATVEECSKTKNGSESLVDQDSEDQTHVISNVQGPVESSETVEVPPQAPTQINEEQPLEAKVSSKFPIASEEFPQLHAGSRSRENSAHSNEIISREESIHTSSESGDSQNSDFSKEFSKAFVYKTMKRARVRVDKTSTSDEVGILDAGKYVHIVFVEGKKGRIVEPLNGWVSMRKNKKAILTQVFNNFEAPTVILSNLDPSLTREKDVLNFLRKQDCRPTRCIWQKKDDFVTVFFTKHKDASKLVRGKFVCNNTELKAVWADGYAKTVQL